MNKSRWPALLLVVALLVVGVGLYTHFHGKSGQQRSHGRLPVLVSLAPVERRDMPRVIRAVGTVKPYQTVAINSRIESQIVAVKFHDGDEVDKGQLLFQLDDRAIKAQLDQAQAALERDQAQLDNLQQQYRRNQTMIKQEAVSEQTLQDSKFAVASQKAVVAADQAALENLRTQLAYTRITAPISGRTGTINVTVGNNVKANDTALVTINQVRPVYVQAALPQQDFDPLRQAMSAGPVAVTVSRASSPEKAQGTLAYIDNGIDQSTGTFVTRSVFANDDEHLWPGMLVSARIRLGIDKQVLVVPEQSVQTSYEGEFVFVVTGSTEKKAHKRPIQLLRTQAGLALIKTGLKPGDVVVTDGMMSLTDGAPVRVRPVEKTTAANKAGA